jgi:hypothetical protein
MHRDLLCELQTKQSHARVVAKTSIVRSFDLLHRHESYLARRQHDW